MAKCRFNHTREVQVWREGELVVEERLVQAPHMHEKICDDCRAAGRTKADDKQLRANR